MSDTRSSVSRLRATREIQHKSLEAVADPVGISASHLSRIERGLKAPSVEVLVRIGRELGLHDLVENIELFWDES